MEQDSKDPIDEDVDKPRGDALGDATADPSAPLDGSHAADDGEVAAETEARAESGDPDANLERMIGDTFDVSEEGPGDAAESDGDPSKPEGGMEEPAESTMIPKLEILDDDEEDIGEAPSPEPMADDKELGEVSPPTDAIGESGLDGSSEEAAPETESSNVTQVSNGEGLDETEASSDSQEEGVRGGSAETGETGAIEDAEEGEVAAMPTADDILKQAGSILNSGAQEPIASEEADEDLVAMPDPSAMLAQATGEDEPSNDEEEEESFAAMPSPEQLMAQAGPEGGEEEDSADAEGDGAASAKSEDSQPTSSTAEEGNGGEAPGKGASGNVADRSGELPPPPPAPVSIDDDEEEAVSDEAPPVAESPEQRLYVMDEAEEEESETPQDSVSDPFASNDLDGFNTALSEEEEIAGSDEIFADMDVGEGASESRAEKPASTPGEIIAVAPTRWKRWFNAVSIAAAVALLGAGIGSHAFKNEILEWVEGRDLDGSGLARQISTLTKRALEELDQDGRYEMRWIDSSLKRAAEHELWLFARIGAHLKRDLYLPAIDDSVVRQIPYREAEIREAARFLADGEKTDELVSPEKPWSRLVRLSASRSETVRLRASYRFTRESNEADWQLSDIRVRGEEEGFVWPEGAPLESYGERTYDVESGEFEKLVRDYQGRVDAFLASVNQLRDEEQEDAARLARLADEKREELLKTISKGSFYRGMVISGVDAADARDATMVITETRASGTLIKGVIKLNGQGAARKHFTGNVKIERRADGEFSGLISLATLAFDGAIAPEQELPEFFSPGTVMRLKLRTDGRNLVGDTRDLSMRFVRAM